LVSSREDAKKLLDAALDLYKKLKVSNIELRTLSSAELLRVDGFKEVDYFKHHYLLLTKEPEELKRTFHNTSVRGKINKAYRKII